MRRRIGMGALAALTLGAAACGSATTSDADGQAVVQEGERATAAYLASAAETTAATETGRFEITVSSGFGGAFEFEMTGEGAYDLANDRYELTYDLGSMMANVVDAAMAFGGDEVPEGLGDPDSWTMTLVGDGDVLYYRSPMLAALGGLSGDTWVRLDPAELADELESMGLDPSTDLGDLTGGGGSPMADPSAYLEWLRGAGADITDVGSDTVRGVDTTHFRATISLGQVLDASGTAEDRARLEESMTMLGDGYDTLRSIELPVDVFVDDQDQVRRLAMTLDFGSLLDSMGSLGSSPFGAEAGDALSMSMTMSVDYYDLGEPVDIAVPAAQDTVSFTEVLDSVGIPGR